MDLPNYQDVVAAREPVYRHLHPTPLHHDPVLSERLAADVYLKHENHLPTRAFKVRGGVTLAARLSPGDRRAGLYTASTGNHGQSIAFGGRAVGAPVTVAVPRGANRQKVEAMRALGAEVVAHGADFDEAREWMAQVAHQRGARFIGPTDPELIAGVGTYALEILEALPEPDVILVPVGAGSGACGVCLVTRRDSPKTRIVGVQAERAPVVQQSWRARSPVAGEMATRAEGLATRVAHQNTLDLMCDPERGLDDFVLVSDEALDAAVVDLLQHTRNLAEHAGAAAWAAALEHREVLDLQGKRVVIVLSGGNLAFDALTSLLRDRAAEAATGR